MGTANRICTSCSTLVPADAVFCPSCGSAVPTSLLKDPEDPQARLEHAAKASWKLPPDLLDKARRRLGVAALMYAAAYLLSYAPGYVLTSYAQGGVKFDAFDVTAATCVLLSVALYAVTRRGNVDNRLLLNLGLVYLVVGAVGIEANETLAWLIHEWGRPNFLTWTSVWIVLFPLIVPSTPGKMLLAAVAAAFSRALMLLIAVGMGLQLPELAWLGLLPNFICAGIAVVGSRVVYGMSLDIGRARRMGSYRLVARLGEGGMGEVWRAKHHMLARPAAIKLIRPETLGAGDRAGQADALRRFEREAQATALLRSPHTVELFDYGVTDDGTFYYVMELLDGLDLETLVQWFGPLPAPRAVHLLRQVCHSLREAHDQGLTHRDIKPANIYVCRYGGEVDFVKVLDFGLVKSGQDSARQDVTATGVGIVGTPSTMAPEQIVGNRPIDARTDIYGLGCVGYWLLTGTHVFEEETVAQVMARHLETLPTPPSQRVEREIPESVDAVILACLEKDPAKRPQTADALSALLTECVGGEQWTVEDARQWWSERIPAAASEAAVGEQRILMPSLVDNGKTPIE
jgi:serine/threonine-protein kinase